MSIRGVTSAPTSRAWLLAAAFVCALLLAAPQRTVVTTYLSDFILVLDGAHRVSWGLVPNADFQTPLGPLTYYLPALGAWVSGSYGAAMPTAMALLVLAFAPALIHVAVSRLSPVLAIVYGVFVILLIAVPITLGEGVTALTFAKFYNRVGWAALGGLLVMFIAPRRAHHASDTGDALSAAFFVLVALYTKASYGLAAFAFLVFMLSDRRQRRWVTMALASVVAACLLIEAAWRSSLEHLADVGDALSISGAIRGSPGQIIDHILRNFSDFTLFALLTGLSLWRTRSLRDGFFYLCCAAGGFLIINQNFQAWGIVTLHAASVVAVEKMSREETVSPPASSGDRPLAMGARLVFLAFVLPTILHCFLALGIHTGAAVAKSGSPIGLPNLERIHLAELWTWGEHEKATRTIATVREGVAALEAAGETNGPVLALDEVNPFPLVMGTRPPRFGAAWLSWGRTIDARTHVPRELQLRDARIVMVPRGAEGAGTPQSVDRSSTAAALYAPGAGDSLEVIATTPSWSIHRRSDAPAQTSCLGCRADPAP